MRKKIKILTAVVVLTLVVAVFNVLMVFGSIEDFGNCWMLPLVVNSILGGVGATLWSGVIIIEWLRGEE